MRLPTFGRALNRAALFLGSTANRFEGHGNDRRWQNVPTSTNSQDLDVETDREQIIGAARSMCNLFGLGNRILRTYANYTVGDCAVSWHTEDEKWNDKVGELFTLKSKMVDVRGREDFPGMARMAVIHMLRDGDIGFGKIANPGYPMLEPYEADRIGPRSLCGYQKENMVGGVTTDAFERPITYHVARRAPSGYGYYGLKPIPAQSFLHMYDNLRFDATRGVSAFAQGALGRSRTIRQLLRSEETGVQTANKWAILLKMANPTAPIPGLDLSDNDEGPGGDTGKDTGPKVMEIYDGMIQKLGLNESVETVQNNRPSPAWMGFIDFLIRDFAISLDLPVEFVWNMSELKGPAVRLTSRQAERTFGQTWNVLLRRFLNPYIAWWIADQMEAGIVPFNQDYLSFMVQRPAHPTIDAGRESQANVAEYDKGFMSGLEICGERGKNVYVVQRQKAREIKYAYDLAKEFDIPPDSIIKEISGKPAGGIPGQSPNPQEPGQPNQQQNKPEPDDDDETDQPAKSKPAQRQPAH